MAQSPEQKKSYKIAKRFKGINTKAHRTAIDEDQFSWLENVMPIGFGNLKIIPNATPVLNNGGSNIAFSNTVTALDSFSLTNNDLIAAFEADGRAEYANLTTGVTGTIAGVGTFSSSGVRSAQWKNDRVMITDPEKGLFTYDGNNTVIVGSVGQIGLVSGGSGYTGAPSVTISAPNDPNGVQAVGNVTISNNVITSVYLTEAGTGYWANSPPTVTIAGGGGTGANAVASVITFAKGTVSCQVLSGGTGYTNAANIVVAFTGGDGTNAAAIATTSGNLISSIIMTNPGQNYTIAPNVTISGGGGSNAVIRAQVQSNNVVDVATFSGRVWVAQGRTVTYSGAGSYNNFIDVSAGSVTLTDSTLHNNIDSILAANNFLYLFGDDSINVFSDVRVTTSGATLFTNTNVSASIGSRRKGGIFPYFRSVLFLNDYGVYALVGSTATKISDDLDGIFPYIDFSKPITSGQVLLNNILCAAFSFTYNDPQSGARVIQAVFFDKKWFLTSQGAFDYVVSVPFAGFINFYGTVGLNLQKLYASTTSNISSTVQSALWDMGDAIRDKQALKWGVEAIIPNATTISVTTDSEFTLSNASTASTITQTNTVSWTNNASQVVSWTNNSSQVVLWVGSTSPTGYVLLKSDAKQWGKYLGLTLTSNSPNFTVSTLEMEHELRARF